MSAKLTQHTSKHFKLRGKFMIKYAVSVAFPYTFTDIPILHEAALGCVGDVSEDGHTLTWVEESSGRATKYDNLDLQFMFEDLVFIK